jgi:hypothetical protein
VNIQKFEVAHLLQTTAEYNPRKELKSGDKEYEKLKKSIQEFGYVDPVIYNETTGRLVGGHQRLKVLAELGYEEVDVSVVTLDEKAEKALNIRLNKSSGDWDNAKLAELLEDLSVDFDLELTGFEQPDLDDLVRELDFQNTMNASFLDDIIDYQPEDTDQYEDDSVDEYKDEDEEKEEEGRKEELFTLKYPVTYEDRDIVMEAIAMAKRNGLAETSPEAIVQICNTFIKLSTGIK